MENHRHFTELIPYALRSIPYILQSHVFKAYCALENLYVCKPHLPKEVWEHCVALIRDDEPKVAGVIAPELLEIEEVVDHTSGRDFGPDWILARGLMPLSYWAIHKKIKTEGFPSLFQSYLTQALKGPIVLGHEISVLSGNWQFYRDVIAQSPHPEHHTLFSQRFTEYVTTTFAHGNDTTFEHPKIDEVPSSTLLLREALHNPGFFGHNVLACVWAERLKPYVSPEDYQQLCHNLTVLVRWHEFGQPPYHLEACSEAWSEETLDEHLVAFFLQGPTNIHQITLAEVLISTWNKHPAHRDLVAANLKCFMQGTRPTRDEI